MAYGVYGFQDVFQWYGRNLHGPAGSPSYSYAFQRAKACDANTIRFAVDWSEVQPTNASSWTFDTPGDLYAGVRLYAAANSLKVIPICLGAPQWIGAILNGNGGRYPAPGWRDDYGRFVVKTAQYFDAWQILAGVEVWNEPNNQAHGSYVGHNWSTGNPQYVDDTDAYGEMLGEALAQLDAVRGSLNYPGVPVLGGSFSMSQYGPQRPANWSSYFTAINNQCFPWVLSIHPYCDTPTSVGVTVSEVTSKYSMANTLVANNNQQVNDIWVTETGAPSNSLGEPGQASATSQISSFLAGQQRCKSMLYYRLYDQDGQDVPTTFNTYAAHRPTTWAAKAVCTTLQNIWP